MYLFFLLSGVINAIVSLLFGLLIFFKNYRSQANRAFALFCLSVAVWAFPYIFWPLANTKDSALLWFQLLHIGASFTPITYFYFVVNWLELKEKKIKIFLCLGFILAIFFSFFVFSSLFISDMVPKYSMRYWAEPGILYHFYLVYFFAYAIYSSVVLLREYKKAKGQKKIQIKFLLIGMVLAFIGGSTNYPLWYDINFPPYGTILVVGYVALSAYAIIAHRLMDIQFVMRRYSVYSVSIFLVILLTVIARYLINLILSDYINLVDFILLFAAISIFPSIKNVIYSLANKYFFSSLYDGGKVIAAISKKLQSTLDLDQIYEYVYKSLDDAMHIKSFAILGYDNEYKEFVVEYNKNFDIGMKLSFTENDYLQETFIKNNKPIIIPEYKLLYYNRNTKEAIDKFEALGVEILCSLVVKNRVVGLMLFGLKESGDLFNEEDLQVISIASSQSAIAIENAMLFEETKNFSVKMESEVKRATADLMAANERLMKLDEAKSEFISIASHQLRTPLTVIKGYISMILEGSFGGFTDVIKSSLNKVYQSNERLINLVENLLNISRIESGNLKFNYEKAKLQTIVTKMMEDLREAASAKGVELELKLPKKELPEILMDPDKIKQVVLNLIDNAIKYTSKGKVIVSISNRKDWLRFSVSDKGIGVKEDDMPNLFKKFSRGDGAMLEYTEGTGLGLFVSKQLIEAHKGNIWVESKGNNKGSKFCFELPMKPNSLAKV